MPGAAAAGVVSGSKSSMATYGDLSEPPAAIDNSVEVRDSIAAQQPQPQPEPAPPEHDTHGHSHGESHGHSNDESVGEARVVS